jgi:hypothetical protein
MRGHRNPAFPRRPRPPPPSSALQVAPPARHHQHHSRRPAPLPYTTLVDPRQAQAFSAERRALVVPVDWAPSPAKRFEVSRRPLPSPSWGRDIEYLPHLDVVRVSKLGYIRSPIGAVFISTALVHEKLGLNVLTNRRCEVFFGQVRLGHIERSWGPRRTIRFVTDPDLSPMSSEREEPQSSL